MHPTSGRDSRLTPLHRFCHHTRLSIWLAAIGISAPTAASAQTIYSPHSRYETREGSSSGWGLASYSNARYQLADGNLRNRSIILRQLSFRLDDRFHDVSTAMGRTFHHVSLKMSTCTQSNMVTDMTKNPTGPQKSVFNAPVTLPTVSGRPPAQSWSVRFPFARAFASFGTADVLADFQFWGGKLHNNATWHPRLIYPYLLDTISLATTSRGKSESFSASRCRDSAFAFSPFTRLSLDASRKRGNAVFELKTNSTSTAPNSTVVHLLDFSGSRVGFTVPSVTCARLHVATSPVLTMTAMATDRFGNSPQHSFGIPGGQVPYDAAAVGLGLWMQAAWPDSATNELKLTNAVATEVPRLPYYTNYRLTKRVCCFAFYSGPIGHLTFDPGFNPICKYN